MFLQLYYHTLLKLMTSLQTRTTVIFLLAISNTQIVVKGK
jgi:hypothetical protein